MLGIRFFRDIDIKNICFKSVNKDNIQYNPINMSVDNLGQKLHRLILPVMLSQDVIVPIILSRRERRKVSKYFIKEESLTRQEELGNMADLSDTLTDVCSSISCRLNQPNGQERDIDRLCYKIFCKIPLQNEMYFLHVTIAYA